ncbi:c-type cytochrome [Puniceibacterium sp. IMCC21224]|uniref:c-type cytochrome n=1 Tax=Puniceibacterium sp. IMCC21224 TaxID=1618204 RepID=UPI00064DD0BF|nr:c-type cytochrome [Puniceibacterium sp. IMCC21224]KMK65746.1 WD-40 repeat-containing protein [Puniceibacterium sp. IMCC21224]
MRGVILALLTPTVLTLGLAARPIPAASDEYFALSGHGGPIMGIAVSPAGRIATASFDNAVGLWQDETPRWLDQHRAAVNCVLFVSETELISGGDDFALVRWDLTTGTATQLEGHAGKVKALALSPDGATLASASWDGSIGIWSLTGGATQFLRGHSGAVNDVVFSDDGTRLYSASADGSLRVWDVATGQEALRLVEHGFGINELALNDVAGWLAYGAVDGGTRVVDPVSGNELADLSLDRRPILALAASNDGSLLAVGDGEGYIMVVDTATWRVLRDFRAAARGPVWTLAFSPDGANIHAGGLDDTLHSWPIATIDEHGQMQTTDRSFLADPDAMPNGERQFKRKCSICHSLTPGSARKAGPSLSGLFGRQAGTVADYTYSPALDKTALIWTAETVDALFDIGPEHYIPGTKMPMQRITGAQDRADLIAYLRAQTAPKE